MSQNGVVLAAIDVKECIMGKGKPQSRSRFNASGGSYRNTVSGYRPGYQPP